MKILKLILGVLLIHSCSKNQIDFTPKKVMTCNDFSFEYVGDKLYKIHYLSVNSNYIKFIYSDTIITQIEYYIDNKLDTRTYLYYNKENNIITEIDTTFQDYGRYNQERRVYNYISPDEVDLTVISNDWQDTVLRTNWLKKYTYKNGNLIQIKTKNRIESFEYDNFINPFYYIKGLNKLKYFSIFGNSILLNNKNNVIKFNTLIQSIQYNERNQPISFYWDKELIASFSY